MSSKRCIACDLDGTLAEYTSGDFKRWKESGVISIGKPITEALARVKAALARRHIVWIFTSRLGPELPDGTPCDPTGQAAAIAAWTIEHVGQRLDATAVKLARFDEFWDDKAVRIAKNNGATGFTADTLWAQMGAVVQAERAERERKHYESMERIR